MKSQLLQTRDALRALAVVLPVFWSCSALAWTLVVHKGGSQFNFDEANVRRQGEFYAVTTLTNFDEPYKRNERGIRYEKNSMSASVLLDCTQKRFQTLDNVWYDDAWGKGVGHRFNTITPQWFGPEWKHYALNMNTQLFKYICK